MGNDSANASCSANLLLPFIKEYPIAMKIMRLITPTTSLISAKAFTNPFLKNSGIIYLVKNHLIIPAIAEISRASEPKPKYKAV